MSLTPRAARQIRVCVIAGCVIAGAALPFFIPGAAAVPAFTDIEARIGYGLFSVLIHALIGGVIGAGLAEFVVWARGGSRERPMRDRRSRPNGAPDGSEHR